MRALLRFFVDGRLAMWAGNGFVVVFFRDVFLLVVPVPIVVRVVFPFVVVVLVYCSLLQVTLVLVAPVTVAVRLTDWPRIRLVLGVTVTETTLAVLPPPQPPDKNTHRAASAVPRVFKTSRCFTPTISPTLRRLADFFAKAPLALPTRSLHQINSALRR